MYITVCTCTRTLRDTAVCVYTSQSVPVLVHWGTLLYVYIHHSLYLYSYIEGHSCMYLCHQVIIWSACVCHHNFCSQVPGQVQWFLLLVCLFPSQTSWVQPSLPRSGVPWPVLQVHLQTTRWRQLLCVSRHLGSVPWSPHSHVLWFIWQAVSTLRQSLWEVGVIRKAWLKYDDGFHKSPY